MIKLLYRRSTKVLAFIIFYMIVLQTMSVISIKNDSQMEVGSKILPALVDVTEDTMATVQGRINAAENGGTVYINNSFKMTGSTPLLINKSITIEAIGDETLIIRLAEGYTERHIRVSGTDVTLTFKGVELEGHNTTGGGGIQSSANILKLNDAVIRNCMTSTNGGGIYSVGAVTINGGDISNNKAQSNGGGIYTTGTVGIVTVTDAKINGNTAANYGGGIYAGSLIVKGATTINENKTTTHNPSLFYGGGGIYSAGNLEINGGTITGNTSASFGGGIYAGYNVNSTITINDATIRNNIAVNAGGGGIYSYNSSCITKVINSTINENTLEATNVSNAYGGGIFTYGPIEIIGTEIRGNTASAYGGGIYTNGNTVSIENSTINQNTALNPERGYGGGVYCNNASAIITIKGGSISSNKSYGNGGGIYAGTGNIAIKGSGNEIIGNTATTGVGGGIYVSTYNKLLEVTETVFSNNSSIKPLHWDLNAVPSVKDYYITNIHPISLSSDDYGVFPNVYNNYDVNYTLPNQTLCTVTFNGNGATSGASEIASKTGYIGEIIYLSGKGTLEKTNHNFLGWSTDKNAKEAEYGGRAGYTVLGSVVLYAVWGDADQYLVTYDINGADSGFVPEDIKAYYLGAAVMVEGNTGNLTKENHVFLGWSIDANAVSPDPSFTMGENGLKVYAVWQEKAKYTVAYDANKGTGTAHLAKTYYEDTNITILGQGLITRIDYTFLGWDTDPNADTAKYKQGDTIKIIGDVTFYAIWKQENNIATTPDNPESSSNGTTTDNLVTNENNVTSEIPNREDKTTTSDEQNTDDNGNPLSKPETGDHSTISYLLIGFGALIILLVTLSAGRRKT